MKTVAVWPHDRHGFGFWDERAGLFRFAVIRYNGAPVRSPAPLTPLYIARLVSMLRYWQVRNRKQHEVG